MLATCLLGLVFQQDAISTIQKLVDHPELASSQLCICIENLKGDLIYQLNGNKRILPASNQKLFTCAFALHELGPDFTPITRFWKDVGTITVESSGDPTMRSGYLESARRTLNPQDGCLVLVKQAYRPMLGPGWEWDDLDTYYASPVTAFSADGGSAMVWSIPQGVRLQPNYPGYKVFTYPTLEPLNIEYQPQYRLIVASGLLPQTKTFVRKISLQEPDRAAASLIGDRFQLIDTIPSRKPDYVIPGEPIKEILPACLQPSDNNIAEHLLFMASQHASPTVSPTFESSARSLVQFLTKTVGIKAGDVFAADGSGLSRHNLATAKSICTLLNWAYRQNTKQLWLSSLAYPGDGTLKNRLQGSSFIGKTGTMSSVCSLSGYVKAKSGETLVVSIIENNYLGSSVATRALQDSIIRAIEQVPMPESHSKT